jgi:hypothetical protein
LARTKGHALAALLTCAKGPAAALADRIGPNPHPAMPLPIEPETWLVDLRRSIRAMGWAQ